jgi:hypothetical protein
MLNHDDSVLKLQTIKDIFSKPAFQDQSWKTTVFVEHYKLKSLTYNTVELQCITHFLNKQEKAIQALTKKRTIDTRYAIIQHEICKNCPDCPTLSQPDIKTSVFKPKQFLLSIRPMIIFEDPHFQSLFKYFDKLKCRKAQRILAAQNIQQTIDACIVPGK